MSRPVYIIELEPLPHRPPGVEFLRRLLKGLLRSYGYRCLDVREKRPEQRPGKVEAYSKQVEEMVRCSD